MNEAQYAYALSSDGKIINISKVTRENRESYGGFTCSGCRGAMSAKLRDPSKNSERAYTNHFAHQAFGSCAPESYLHISAKTLFFQKYQFCLEGSTPFILELEVPALCDAYHSETSMYCETTQLKKFDLTKLFDRVELEKGKDGVIADVLLTNTKDNLVMFVEIAVTHACEDSKIAKGHRILELNVSSEKDLEPIEQCHINEVLLGDKMITHNFKRGTVKENTCSGECREKFSYILIQEDGYTSIENFTQKDAQSLSGDPELIYSKILVKEQNKDLDGNQSAFKYAREAFFHTGGFDSCVGCKNADQLYMKLKGSKYGQSRGLLECRCDEHHYVDSNTALSCPDYLPYLNEQQFQIELAKKRKAGEDFFNGLEQKRKVRQEEKIAEEQALLKAINDKKSEGSPYQLKPFDVNEKTLAAMDKRLQRCRLLEEQGNKPEEDFYILFATRSEDWQYCSDFELGEKNPRCLKEVKDRLIGSVNLDVSILRLTLSATGKMSAEENRAGPPFEFIGNVETVFGLPELKGNNKHEINLGRIARMARCFWLNLDKKDIAEDRFLQNITVPEDWFNNIKETTQPLPPSLIKHFAKIQNELEQKARDRQVVSQFGSCIFCGSMSVRKGNDPDTNKSMKFCLDCKGKEFL